MIAYVFWHAPRGGVDAEAYERGMLDLHAVLAAAPPDGFRGSGTLRLPPRPALPWPEPAWLDAGGYEDWYLLDGFADLEALKRAAVDAARLRSHDAVAGLAGHGAAGVYQLCSGDPIGGADAGSPGAVAWWSKPDGMPYEAVSFDGVAEVWQRQLVLGPAPEFRLVAPSGPVTSGRSAGSVLPVPGWTAVSALHPASASGEQGLDQGGGSQQSGFGPPRPDQL